MYLYVYTGTWALLVNKNMRLNQLSIPSKIETRRELTLFPFTLAFAFYFIPRKLHNTPLACSFHTEAFHFIIKIGDSRFTPQLTIINFV